MVHDYIPIDVDSMMSGDGYTQPIDLDSGTYVFSFYFNKISRCFYVDIDDEDGNNIKAGEPIYLNQPILRDINKAGFPTETIIPLDESGIETEITPANFGDTVQLCIDSLDGDINDENED